MTAEKASTLRLLKQGMGQTVVVLHDEADERAHRLRARLDENDRSRFIPTLFLLSSLSFLEAGPESSQSDEYNEVDGWTPVDVLSHLRIDSTGLHLRLGKVRGRSLRTTISLSHKGDLSVVTEGRGRSALRWLGYVQGAAHLKPV